MNKSIVLLILAMAAFAYVFLGCCDDCPTEPQEIPEPREYIAVDSIPYINELDCDNADSDTEEFIELFTTAPHVPLDGYVVVLYNGNGDASYQAYDLDSYSTDSDGFFVLGAAAVPNVDLALGTESIIQNGADAVALYKAEGSDFTPGTPVTNTNLIDAIVYDTNDMDASVLISVLMLDGIQLNEDAEGTKDTVSLQRLPDGSGGYRQTTTFRVSSPTPGTGNK